MNQWIENLKLFILLNNFIKSFIPGNEKTRNVNALQRVDKKHYITTH